MAEPLGDAFASSLAITDWLTREGAPAVERRMRVPGG